MKVVVFHGSPRKGNTYKATQIFCNALSTYEEVYFEDYFLQSAIPQLCTGCQLCFSNPNEKCPHAEYIVPLLDTILAADALIFTTPHHGASSMSSGMKNLLDHLDFLTFVVAPRKELFSKKALIITTGSGSTAAMKPIKKCLKNWGLNRVYAIGFRMFTDKWEKLSAKKQTHFENRLQRMAHKFYHSRKKPPYISTLFMFNISKMILKKYIGKGTYPYEYWRENGYFENSPFSKS